MAKNGENKVFGVGFGKTGTTSLENALEILGYNVCRGDWRNNYSNYLIGLYVNNDIDRILRFVKDYDAFFDAPWGGTDLVEALTLHYPDAKYILSWRDPEKWYQSFERELSKPFSMQSEFEENRNILFDKLHSFGRYGDAIFWPFLFGVSGLSSGEREIVIEKYIERNNKNIAHLEKNNCRYLKINITEGEGWNKVCPFLGVDMPEERFPHANRSPGFQEKSVSKKIKLKHRIKRSVNGFARLWLNS